MPRKSHRKSADRMETFARQFVILNSNGTQAAIAAGYSKKTAAFQASALLKKHKVKALIASFIAASQKKMDYSVEKVLERMAIHAFCDPKMLVHPDGKFKTLNEMDAHTAACVASIEMDGKHVKRIRLADSQRSLEMLAKYYKLFAEDRAPQDYGVKVIVLDMPRPLRQVGSGAAALPPSNGHNGNGSKPHDD